MVNPSPFASDPRIDKPWGSTLREKLPRSVRLWYVNWGSMECQHWADMADGSGGFSSHLVTPNSPKPKITLQPADVCEITDLDGKGVVLELSSDSPENMPTPTRTSGQSSSIQILTPKNSIFQNPRKIPDLSQDNQTPQDQ